MAYMLWQRHLKHDPRAPQWFDRDRFVLSAGHGSMLLYSLLHLTGYDLSLDELKQFRQWGSKTPGHPEWHDTPGVEATTGPLGQGAANAVGMAIAERYLAHHFNRPGHTIIDHHTYALVSDGDVMEGVACEAASLAGHLGLGKLIYLYDANQITLDGPLSLVDERGRRRALRRVRLARASTSRTATRDLAAIDAAIRDREGRDRRGRRSSSSAPRSASARRRRPARASAHGSPLGDAEVAATKTGARLGSRRRSSSSPTRSARTSARRGKRGAAAHAAWRERLAAYKAAHPELARAARARDPRRAARRLGRRAARRSAGARSPRASPSGKVMGAIAAKVPWLFGGDADLGGSTKTIVPGGDYDRTGAGRNLRFGIREHAMGSIGNGMLYHGGVRPFVADVLRVLATTCARRCGSPRSTSSRRSSCGRTTRSASARTARRTSRSST